MDNILKFGMLGAWMQIGHPAVAEILANAGFKWICVDLEHGVIDLETMANIFRAIEKYDCIATARLPVNDATWIHRSLDAGADMLIIPMVKTVEDAECAIKESKYPPEGTRGFGYNRANVYGNKFKEYTKTVDPKIILQIEHIDAINNLEEILQVTGIDGTFIGPYDLSGSMGIVGQFEHSLFKDAINRYSTISERYMIPKGIHIVHPNSDNITDALSKNYSLIALGLDTVFLEEQSRSVLDIVGDYHET